MSKYDAFAESMEDFGSDDEYGDIFCGTCGKLVTDGGGLYCSARCENIANPDGDSDL